MIKRLGSLTLLSSVLLLTACNSELEVVHNETYYGAKEEDKVLEKPIEVVEETQEDTTEEKVEATKEDNSSIRNELEKRAEELKEKEDGNNVTTTQPTEPKAEPKKEKPKEKEVFVMEPSTENIEDWQGAISKINKEDIDKPAKIRKLTTFTNKYVSVVTDKEVQQFRKTLLNEYKNGLFTESLNNDKDLLTYLFKSHIVAEKTSKQSDYSGYMFMNTFYTFLEDIYLISDSLSEAYVDEKIDKLDQIYSTIE